VRFVEEETTKDCPICNESLKLSEFGVCRARKDGRNLYCKGCIRKKVAEQRASLRAYKSARLAYVQRSLLADAPPLAPPVSRVALIDRVRLELEEYSCTFDELLDRCKATRQEDEMSDVLAVLVLETDEVAERHVAGERFYYKIVPDELPELPARKPHSWARAKRVPMPVPKWRAC
jgi:hypothetical protein